MQLKTALKQGKGLTPKAHLVHCALAVLGPGEYTPAEICAVLGYVSEGRGSGKFQTRVTIGARQLRNYNPNVCQITPSRKIVATEFYAKATKGARDAA